MYMDTIVKLFLEVTTKLKYLEHSFGSIFVYADIRPSMFITELEEIKKIISIFPNFKYTEYRDGYFVHKKETNIPFVIGNSTEYEFGSFLGYPCAGDIIDNRKYGYQISATYKGSTEIIYGMICGDMEKGSDRYRKVKQFEKKIYTFVDDLNKYLDDKIVLVTTINKIYTPIELFEYIGTDKLTDAIKDEVIEVLWNGRAGILVALHSNEIINIFNDEYTYLIKHLLLQANASFEWSIPFNNEAYDVYVTQNIKYLCDVLKYQHNVIVSEEIIKFVYEAYTKNLHI